MRCAHQESAAEGNWEEKKITLAVCVILGWREGAERVSEKREQERAGVPEWWVEEGADTSFYCKQ